MCILDQELGTFVITHVLKKKKYVQVVYRNTTTNKKLTDNVANKYGQYNSLKYLKSLGQLVHLAKSFRDENDTKGVIC